MVKAFHGKGLWYYPDFKKSQLPSATIIGSSNFGHRSVNRDLEANLLICTKDNELQRQLNKVENIYFFHLSIKNLILYLLRKE